VRHEDGALVLVDRKVSSVLLLTGFRDGRCVLVEKSVSGERMDRPPGGARVIAVDRGNRVRPASH
jgi:hypothetical protein